MTVTVLFLCPHAAGKSILAATYFQAAAARLGLDAVAAVAGPEPENELGPRVRKALHDQGFVERWTPRLVTPDDTACADVIVNIGCELSTIPTHQPMIEWDVPLLTDDFQGSMTAIYDHAESLVLRLLNQSG